MYIYMYVCVCIYTIYRSKKRIVAKGILCWETYACIQVQFD